MQLIILLQWVAYQSYQIGTDAFEIAYDISRNYKIPTKTLKNDQTIIQVSALLCNSLSPQRARAITKKARPAQLMICALF
jgi:hypothetical protein